MAEIQRDITRTVLAVFFIVALMGSSIWILRPFLGAVIWAATIVIATWPFMRMVEAWLWDKRWLAVAAMTFLLLAVLVAPLSLAIGAIVANVDEIAEWARSLQHFTMAPTPEWLRGLPLIGGAAVEAWRYAAAAGIQDIAAKAAPYAGIVLKWFVAQLGNIGVLFVEFLLTVVLAAAMYANGESASERVVQFGRRLAGSGGENAVRLAGQTIRGVALGIVGTALAQSLLAGIGLLLAGVPFAAVLTAVIFILCIAQLGPVLVLAPAVIWLYWVGSTLWGTFLLACSVVAVTMDNFLRPILIKRGADLPLLLIFAGVIGGLLAFGLIGLFVGPVVLAVAQKLLTAWIDGDVEAAETADPQQPAGG
jgi:predicted PurR-regulated permease PerM